MLSVWVLDGPLSLEQVQNAISTHSEIAVSSMFWWTAERESFAWSAYACVWWEEVLGVSEC